MKNSINVFSTALKKNDREIKTASDMKDKFMSYQLEYLNTRVLKLFLVIINVTLFVLTLRDFYGISYNILSVNPLFFLRYPLLFTIFFGMITLIMFSCTIRYDKISFIVIALMLYYTVFYIPFFSLKFNIYNDQLGFAIETFYGYIVGHVVPYQGEYTTLGHAYFTTVLGKLLALDLYSVVKYVEAVLVFVSFLIYVSFAMGFIKKHARSRDANLMAVAALLIFPSFALEPLVYSRGYFGLILSVVLFACLFNFINGTKLLDLITLTIVFVSSSISYPLQPLIFVFSMITSIFIHRFSSLFSNTVVESSSSFPVLRAIYFFAIWTIVQVFYGYGVWSISHVIVFKILQQEYFTAFKASTALKYVEDALVYVNLRILMMVFAWTISILIVLTLLLKLRRLKTLSQVEQYVLSIIITILLLGGAYGVTFHEPATRFYRTLVAIMPFALLNIRTQFTIIDMTKFYVNKTTLKRILMISLLLILSFFLILSPITKWGWIFVGYPTIHDTTLANYIVSHYVASYYSIYPAGSHGLLSFYFEYNNLSNRSMTPTLLGTDDIRFNLTHASSSSYTATFYRIYLFPRWCGEDINEELDEILTFASQNNLLYNDFPWLLIGSR